MKKIATVIVLLVGVACVWGYRWLESQIESPPSH